MPTDQPQPQPRESRSEVAPYRAIAAALRARIEAGELRPGEQVPSAATLTRTYDVSRNTALRALRLLQDEGLVRVERGWGSFVTQPEERPT